MCERAREKNSEKMSVTERLALKSAFVFLCKKRGSYLWNRQENVIRKTSEKNSNFYFDFNIGVHNSY